MIFFKKIASFLCACTCLLGCDKATKPPSAPISMPSATHTPLVPLKPVFEPHQTREAMIHCDEIAAQMGLVRITDSRMAMGTSVTIDALYEDQEKLQASIDAAFEGIARIEQIFSDYPQSCPDSEVLRLASKAGEGPIQVSDELWEVTVRAKALFEASEGAFDITTRPIVGLWRMGMERNQYPPQEAIDTHMKLVGFSEHVKLYPDTQSIEILTPGAWLDYGGIAKGYALDHAMAVLQQHGIASARIIGGGDSVCSNAPPGLPGWPYVIEDYPTEVDAKPAFWHTNGSVSVSGDTFQVLVIDGVRYSHIVDPRTGQALTGARFAAVKGTCAFDTDALSTLGCILDTPAYQALLDSSIGENIDHHWQFKGRATE